MTKTIRLRFVIAMLLVSVLVVWGMQRLLSVEPSPHYVTHAVGSRAFGVLDERGKNDLLALLEQEMGRLEAGVHTPFDAWIDTEVNAAFDALEQHLEAYLDWYFSAPASYLRLYMSLFGDFTAWDTAQFEQRLLYESGFAPRMQALSTEAAELYAALVQKRVDALQHELAAFVASRGEVLDENALAANVKFLDVELLTHPDMVDVDALRVASSLVSASAVGAGVLTASLYRMGALAAARALVSRFMVRLGVAGMRASAAGAVGTVGTPALGATVGAVTLATLVGAEYMALNKQERAYRPHMEQTLAAELQRARENTMTALQMMHNELTQEMVANIERLTAEQLDAREIKHNFKVLQMAH